MPRRLRVSMLPEQIREQLNTKLRANGYGAFVSLSSWIGSQGHPIGKSALHRYALRLRKVDAANFVGMASVLLTPDSPATKIRNRAG